MSEREKKAAPLILGGGIPTLKRKWRAALAPGAKLPPYEEIVLGSLGRLADSLMLVGEVPETPRVLQAGRHVLAWTGDNVQGSAIDDLPSDCRTILREVIAQSLHRSEPVFTIAHRVRDGLVEKYEVLALPMSCRWGPPVVAI
jgi:hypothetical protein